MELVLDVKNFMNTSNCWRTLLKGMKKVKEGQKKVQVIRKCWIKRTKRKQWICDRIQGSPEQVVIRDSKQSSEFSQLNSLSWAFTRQDKMIKINGIFNGSVNFKHYESYLNTLNTEQWSCTFFVLIICMLFAIEQTNSKNLILKSSKNMIKPLLIWLIYYSTL